MAKNIKDFLGLTPPPSPPDEGLYHYLFKNNDEKTRVHLRVDRDGSGTLLVDAKYVYYLNPTATYMTYLSLEKVPDYLAINGITRFYNIAQKQALNDFQIVSGQIKEIISPNGACPVCDLNLEVITPFSKSPSAPYRMDLALTYKCNNACSHCYNDRTRRLKEFNKEQWIEVLDKLWQLGIPHIIFTGGEPTLYPHLAELIAHAEKNGQITGINTNGRKLKDRIFLNELVDAGLDHIQITLESHDEFIHDSMVGYQGAYSDTVTGIKNVVDSGLYLMTNTTMLRPNVNELDDLLEFLNRLGVRTVGLNALIYSGNGLKVDTGLRETELPDLLRKAQNITHKNDQRLVWYTPTQYCHFDPIQMELGVKGCTAALYNMCIEPDGSVLPCQSYYEPIGNILHNDWSSIWNHELAVSLRNRSNAPDECLNCEVFSTCGGGCPLARKAGKIAPPVSIQNSILEKSEYVS